LVDALGTAGSLLTVAGTIFIAELTDKDALLLLSLATRRNAWLTFAAGSIAFTITSAIIVLVGSALVAYVPIFWIKIAGGTIMLFYALWEYLRSRRTEKSPERGEERWMGRTSERKLLVFLAMLSSLIVLDLAGDATELVTIVFVAQFRNILLVFTGAVLALVAASGVETAMGNRLGRILSASRVKKVSIVVFLVIGTVTIATTIVGL
jgi:putative Ca2+/H+ antiporter (TMEM165/GDT1 family)